MSSVTRRDVLKAITGVATMALATACAQSTSPPAAATPAPSAAQSAPPTVAATGSVNNVIFWGAFTGHNADVLQQLVDRFNGSQKDVQVTLQNQNTYEDLSAKLTAALQAKNAPEIAQLSDVWWFKF